MSWSFRASPTGSTARCIAMMRASARPEPMSLRSSDVVAGNTRSACRAIGVQYGSCTITVSGRPSAPAQAVQILVVVERVAAGPVHQADVGIA